MIVYLCEDCFDDSVHEDVNVRAENGPCDYCGVEGERKATYRRDGKDPEIRRVGDGRTSRGFYLPFVFLDGSTLLERTRMQQKLSREET